MQKFGLKSFCSLLGVILLLAACRRPAEMPIAGDYSFNTDRLNRFEETILKYESADSADFPDENILFIGSSSILLWRGLIKDMEPFRVINRGFGGSTLPEVRYYADRILFPYSPDIVFVYAGENDLANDLVPADEALNQFKLLHSEIREKLPIAQIFFLSIKPSPRRWKWWPKFREANKMIRNFTETKPLTSFLDVSGPMIGPNGIVRKDIFVSDSLHMNSDGYVLWTEVIKPELEKLQVSSK